MSMLAYPGHSRLILTACGIAPSAYYYRSRPTPRGRERTTTTRRADGRLVSDALVLEAIEAILAQEFACYGYRALTAALRREGFVINHKKVYRLTSDAQLLAPQRHGRLVKRLLAPRGKVKAARPYQHLQMDIKYVYIHGERRWAYLLTVLDVFSRCIVGQLFALSVRAREVVALLNAEAPTWTSAEGVRLRTDHGAQFVANELAEALRQLKITHEFTHPGVPEENAFIESWHSIVHREVAERFEFASFDEADETLKRHRRWYQFERLHGSLNYRTPNEVLREYWQKTNAKVLP